MIQNKKGKAWVTPENPRSYREYISSTLNCENRTIDMFENIKDVTKKAVEKFCPKQVK